MESSLMPSVLVVRSMCVPFADSLELEPSRGDTSTHDGGMKTMLHRTLTTLPLVCDITVLPEIPLEPHGTQKNTVDSPHDASDDSPAHHALLSSSSSTRGATVLRMERQPLHPCGMDNILLLHDLPPSAAATYLLSLTSCETTFTQMETHEGGGNVLEMEHPVPVSVQAVPSTFMFSLDNHHHPGHMNGGNKNILVNPRKASAELEVKFDFFQALGRLEGIVKSALHEREKSREEDVVETNQVLISGEESEAVEMNEVHTTEGSHAPVGILQEKEQQCLSPLTSDVVPEKERQYASTTPQHDHHDQLLHVLRQLTEKEARQLDWMLVGLGVVFVLLVLHYARTVSPLIRSNKKRTKSNKSKQNESRPPVNSVTIQRASPDSVPSSKQGRNEPPLFASESSIGVAADSSSLSSATVVPKPIRFLPPREATSETGANEMWNGNNGSDLSPCTKLENQWIQTKEKRRLRRKDHDDGDLIRPSFLEELRQRVDQNAPDIPALAHESSPLADVTNVGNHGQQTSPVPFSSSDRTVTTPETCVVSEDSFLQDYWGER